MNYFPRISHPFFKTKYRNFSTDENKSTVDERKQKIVGIDILFISI
jgi:hypothetical protein